MKTIAKRCVVAASLILPHPATSLAADLTGAWRGGGSVSFASGAKEQATCRARYTQRSNEGYVVSAICATASAKAEQSALLRKISDNTYRGTFHNQEYGVSGTILVRVNGNTQTVRLTSEAGWAALKLTK